MTLRMSLPSGGGDQGAGPGSGPGLGPGGPTIGPGTGGPTGEGPGAGPGPGAGTGGPKGTTGPARLPPSPSAACLSLPDLRVPRPLWTAISSPPRVLCVTTLSSALDKRRAARLTVQ